jgi:hypothetical protein
MTFLSIIFFVIDRNGGQGVLKTCLYICLIRDFAWVQSNSFYFCERNLIG